MRVVQSIASGLLGRAACSGGYRTAALGVVLHFVIALGAAAAFCIGSAKVRWLTQSPWLSGALFGVAVVYAVDRATAICGSFSAQLFVAECCDGFSNPRTLRWVATRARCTMGSKIARATTSVAASPSNDSPGINER